jgi:cysteine desulfurase
MEAKRIYLDYGATTPVDKRVVNAMTPYFRGKFGNASSIHSFGREAKDGIEKARENIALLIKASPEEIYFTSGGTESDTWAISGYCNGKRKKGNHIVTCVAEHPAVLNTVGSLEKFGFTVTSVPLEPDGTISIDLLREACTDKTILISIMHVNNEIGTINDLGTVGTIAKEFDAVFHSDCVQSFGKIPIDVNAMNIDLLSISGHKIYGPMGVGALYIRKGIVLEKLMYGGSQERKKRSGSENVAGIVGFGAAAALCRSEMKVKSSKLYDLSEYFWKRIQDSIPDVKLNGPSESRLAGNLNVSFKDADGESLLLSLDLHGIAASSGSACESGSVEPSHVIKSLNLPLEYEQSALRFTLGRWTSRSEIDYTVKMLKDVVERVRTLDEDFV